MRRYAAKYADKEWVNDALTERDFECLVSLLHDQDTPSDVRDYLAEVVLGLLTGKVKLPAHRPTKRATSEMDAKRGQLVWELKQQKEWRKTSAAVKRAAELLGCSKDTVWKSWGRFLRSRQALREERAQFDAEMDLANEFYEFRWSEAVAYLKSEEGERDFTDEEIEAAAEILDEKWARDNEALAEAHESSRDE